MANETSIASKIWNNPVIFDLRTLFYAVTPNETSFKTLEEVPKYVDKAVPYFVILIGVEMIINIILGHKNRLPRWDDAFSSIGAGMMSIIPLMLLRNIEYTVYIWLHNNYAIYTLDWDSPLTWFLSMIGVDLGYYWVHRCAHEVNFMWAAHQVHHSSEDYNFSTALRQSVLQRYSSWMFYLPMALFIPPPVFIVHIQFNLIYQFWIHTEIVDTVGPLEWILNTPSHHRVHHGRNRYCIDKNYGGTFIIFDRLFGTFAKEENKDELAYGLVHTLKSWDPIYTQLCHWRYIIGSAMKTSGITNKISVFLKGPGWAPGKPRLGYITDIPDIKGPVKKYSRPAPIWLNIYLYIHFSSVLIVKEMMSPKLQEMPAVMALVLALFMIWTLTNIGYFYEQKWYVPYSELLRCVAYLIVDMYVCSGSSCSAIGSVGRMVMGVSISLLLVFCGKQLTGEKIKLQ